MEGKGQLQADPTGTFGKETNLLLDDSFVGVPLWEWTGLTVLRGDGGWHRTVPECGARRHRPPWQPDSRHHLAARRPQALT